MTKDEMIKWAGLDEASDTIWHANQDQLDKLIWIAQLYAKVGVWREIQHRAEITADCFQISSYPSFKKDAHD